MPYLYIAGLRTSLSIATHRLAYLYSIAAVCRSAEFRNIAELHSYWRQTAFLMVRNCINHGEECYLGGVCVCVIAALGGNSNGEFLRRSS